MNKINIIAVVVIMSISLIVVNGCVDSETREYNNKMEEARSYYQLEKIDKAIDIMSKMNLKDEDRVFYINILNEQLDHLNKILGGLEI